MNKLPPRLIALLLLFLLSATVHADSIGIIKALSGRVTIQRGEQQLTASLGAELYTQDQIKTASDGSVGLLLHDDSRLSVGPNSQLSLDQFSFDKTTAEGSADIGIKQGTLSVIAGKMVENKPGALKVKTPAAILAVRGTEFSVMVEPRP